MSKTIDERVVEMRFDNKQFEAGVQTSMSTLGKLKQSLTMDGSSKGLDNLTSSFGKMAQGVESLQQRFSLVGENIRRIANQIISSVEDTVKSLTIAPISQGYDEYELKMGSVQTIMASTGASLEEVNGYLNELNTYADQTIYSFSDMTQNIGKFTNSGVGLKDAVKAIQGISNEAAVSGANANEASRAMYNFAQALSSGAVKLIDWKSIENANMATVEFKNELIKTALELGTIVKCEGQYVTTTTDTNNKVSDLFDATHAFNDSLSHQWMTTEVLVKTLGRYSDETTEIGKKAFAAAQDVKTFTQLMDTLKEAVGSGWATTWETLFGDFNEAKQLWTGVSNTVGGFIDAQSDARNKFLSEGLGSAWKQLVAQGIPQAEEYKNTIYEVAKEHGVAVEEIVEKSGSFEKSLKDGWLTADILAESLDKLAVKFNGLSDEQVRELGYTREQVEALESLNQSAKDGSVSLSDFAQKMTKNSGRENIIQALKNAFDGLLSVIKPIKEAFTEIFPPATAQQLNDFTQKLLDLSTKFKISDETAVQLKTTFKGIFSIFDIAKQAVGAFIKMLSPLLDGLVFFGKILLGAAAYIGEWLVGIDNFIKESGFFNNTVKSITLVIQNAGTTIKNFIEKVKENFQAPAFEIFHLLLERIKERLSGIGQAAENMKNGVISAFDTMGSSLEKNKFVTLLEGIWKIIKVIATGIVQIAGTLMNGIINKLESINFDFIFDLFSTLSLATIAVGIKKFFETVTQTVSSAKGILSSFKGIFENVNKVLGEVKNTLLTYQTQLKAGTLIKIATSVAILAASIAVLSLIDSEKLASSLAAMGGLFGELMGAMAVFSKIAGNISGTVKASATMISMSIAILILAGAMKKLAELDWGQIAKGSVALTAVTGIAVTAAKLMSKAQGSFIKSAVSLVIFSTAVKSLSASFKSFIDLNWGQIAKGCVALTAVTGAAVATAALMSKVQGSFIRSALSLVIFSLAVKNLSSTLKSLSELNWEQIVKGSVALTAVAGIAAAAAKLMSGTKNSVSSGLSLILMAQAMKIFATDMQTIAAMEWGDIGKALATMAVVLAEITLMSNFMPNNTISIGIGLVIIGGALEILTNVLSRTGNLQWEQVAKGLAAVGGVLAELAIGLNVMSHTLAGSAAILVAAIALDVLTPALLLIGNMSWSGIVKALVAIAGAFTILGVSSLALGPMLPVILGLSGAIALLGVGIGLIGAGLIVAGIGLTSLAAGIVAFGTAIGNSLVGSLKLIPMLATKLAESHLIFLDVLADSFPVIAKFIKNLVLSLAGVLVECVPVLVEVTLALISQLLVSLVQHAPEIIGNLIKFIICIFQKLAENLPEIIKVAVDVIMAFFAGMADALSGIDVNVLLKGIVGVGIFAAIIVALGAIVPLIPPAMLGVLGMGAVVAELALVLAAVGALAQIPGLSWLIGEGGSLLEGIGTSIGKFVGGIVDGFMSGVSSQFPQIAKDLSAFMINVQPFIEGAKNIDSAAMDGVKALAETILILTAADILKGLTSWLTGGNVSIVQFGEQLAEFGPYFNEYYKSIKDIDGNVVVTSANAAKAISEMAKNLPNSGGLLGKLVGENDLSDFAKELSEFGPSMKAYADSVAGLDSNVVVNSANAASALSQLAKNLPNDGGVVSLFTGNNSIDVFGEKVAKFGTYFKQYYEDIYDIDTLKLAEVVEETNNIIAMAKGTNDVDTKSMKSFSEALTTLGKTGIDNFIRAFTDAANRIISAAQTMVDTFANTVNTKKNYDKLYTAGKYLAQGFEKGISDRKSSVKSVADSMAKTAINATTKTLDEHSPSKVFYQIGEYAVEGFTDGVSDNFSESYLAGEGLADKFTSGFTENFNDEDLLSSVELFTDKLGSVNTDNLSSALSGIEGLDISASSLELSSLTDTVGELDRLKISPVTLEYDEEFEERMSRRYISPVTLEYDEEYARRVGANIAGNVASGFSDELSNNQISDALTDSVVLNDSDEDYQDFLLSGKDSAAQFAEGIQEGKSAAVDAMRTVINGILDYIRERYGKFALLGRTSAIQFTTAIKEQKDTAVNVWTNILSECEEAINSLYDTFYSAGENLAIGFSLGLQSYDSNVAIAAENMALSAIEAAQYSLQEKSPSKVFYKIGSFAGQGFVNALSDYSDKSLGAGSELAESARLGLTRAISKVVDLVNGDIEVQPTIRPVLDLSNVQVGARRLSNLFSTDQAIHISTGINNARVSEIQNGVDKPINGATYQFTQNNYSPKALSRIEIYRQTKNQFSAMKELVSSV